MPQEGVDTIKEGRARKQESLRREDGGMVNICAGRDKPYTDLTFRGKLLNCLVFPLANNLELKEHPEVGEVRLCWLGPTHQSPFSGL